MTEENQETSDSQPPAVKGISRRDFLKLAAAAVGAALIGTSIPTFLTSGDRRRDVSPEYRTRTKAPTAVLDFFNLSQSEARILRDNFPPGFSAEAAWKRMGVTDPSDIKEVKKAVPTNDQEALLLMMRLLQEHYKDHGNNVTQVMKATTASIANPNKEYTPPSEFSVVSAMQYGVPKYDEMGNITLNPEISAKVIGEMISEMGKDVRVINMSLELGRLPMTYVMYDTRYKHPELVNTGLGGTLTINGVTTYTNDLGEVISKDEYDKINEENNAREVYLLEPSDRNVQHLDGYAGENTFHNLIQLVNVANKHPDKIFVAAGGNPSNAPGSKLPDIRKARAELERRGVWPKNLIIVGYQYSYEGAGFPASNGADIYVKSEDLKKLGFPGASSFATPVITEVVRNLIELGIYPVQVREALMLFTNQETFWEGSNQPEYLVLNFDLVREYTAIKSQK